MEWTAGIDDAGRGPIIGPLVIGGVALPRDSIRDLLNLGVKDSKLLTPSTRTRLADEDKRACFAN